MNNQEKITVLLVDDRPENLLGLQGILERSELSIITADSGNKALTLMMEEEVSLVLLDVQMPGMDGFETVEIMRKNSRTKHIPVIFVTAINKAREYIFKGYELGAIDYICKPIDPDVLINKVNALLAHEMMRRDLKRTVGELTVEIQKRQETEASLREYEVIVSTSSDLLSLIDKNYHYRVVNQAYLDFHQKTREEIIGHSVADLLGNDVFQAGVKVHLDSCLAGEHVHYQSWFEFPGAGRRFMDVYYFPVVGADSGISGVVVNSRDITRTKELEQESVEVRKMKTVGTLAGGVAHKFNNALSAIKGNLELLKMDFPGDQVIGEFINRVYTSSEEMAVLTAKLIAYAEQGKYQPQRLEVGSFVEETISLIKHKVDYGVVMEVVRSGSVNDITGDPTQLQMALTAVIMNGAEAVGGDGTVTVSITNSRMPENESGGGTGCVCLKIEDNGRGMDAETLERIFEPFFTTGFQGRGLSMAAVYGIIRNHSGKIRVESEPGKGTSVFMYLPSFEKEEVMEKDVPEKDSGEEGHRQSIVLLIEDEDIVMEVNTAMLDRLGYRVITAETGAEAVSHAESFKGTIDLALLDIGLPDMDGSELFPLLRKARPDMKVIICSGYSIDTGAEKILRAGADGFLQKPFAFATLAEVLTSQIERRRHSRVDIDDHVMPGYCGSDVTIVDISEGGLAFQADSSVSDEEGLVRVALIMGERGFDLKDVSCNIVAERTVSADGRRVKRKSVSFGEMTKDQINSLMKIIDECSGESGGFIE